jgi:hypothetical protein
MVVEVTPGVFHGVRFDFNVQSDTVVSVARELRDAGLVWKGVSDADLLDMLLDALKVRLKRRSSETPFGGFLLPTAESLQPPPAVAEAVAGSPGEEQVEKMLQMLGVESVREFQSKSGLEESGIADERTWRLLAEQYEVKRKKEEEKIQKREEAKLKAKQENEKKLLIQQQESAKALDVILEKALTDIGTAPSHSPTPASLQAAPGISLHGAAVELVNAAPLSPARPTLSPTSSPVAPPAPNSTTTATSANLLADQLL